MEISIVLAVLFGLFLAYANGSNDNFKGVATLFGSGTASYKSALTWASLAQILGSMTALIIAQGLLAAFSGKGLVPDAVVAMKSFALAVGFGAALTVMLATMMGFPISTTHALTGALVGAGYLASNGHVNLSTLEGSFFAPLLVSPLLAIVAGGSFYLVFRWITSVFGIARETCVCVGTEVVSVIPAGVSAEAAMAQFQTVPTVSIDKQTVCMEKYSGHVLGVSAGRVLDCLHYMSGGVVCFARALNDTPKVAATLLIGGTISPAFAIAGTAGVMVAGGFLNSRKIAETMSHKVTSMNPEQGFAANLMTGLLVIFASRLGLPVSTTHVSVGSLFGIGAVTKQTKWKTVLQILVAWVTTLPVAAISAAVLFLLFKRFI